MENKKTNKILKGLFSLDHNIKLYIPSTTDIDTSIDNREHVNQALSIFSDLFGGSTSYEALGAWKSQDKGLVTEKVTIVESYAGRAQVESGLPKVIEYAQQLKDELKQEAISLEYDNKLYFI